MKTGREREGASEGEEEGAKSKCNSIVGDVMGYLDSLWIVTRRPTTYIVLHTAIWFRIFVFVMSCPYYSTVSYHWFKVLSCFASCSHPRGHQCWNHTTAHQRLLGNFVIGTFFASHLDQTGDMNKPSSWRNPEEKLEKSLPKSLKWVDSAWEDEGIAMQSQNQKEPRLFLTTWNHELMISDPFHLQDSRFCQQAAHNFQLPHATSFQTQMDELRFRVAVLSHNRNWPHTSDSFGHLAIRAISMFVDVSSKMVSAKPSSSSQIGCHQTIPCQQWSERPYRMTGSCAEPHGITGPLHVTTEFSCRWVPSDFSDFQAKMWSNACHPQVAEPLVRSSKFSSSYQVLKNFSCSCLQRGIWLFAHPNWTSLNPGFTNISV